jgi:hypothetical protein
MSANKAIASVRANPRMAYPNNCLVKEGLRATELISEPKTIPIPAPAPAKAIVAQPAPINFAPSNISQKVPLFLLIAFHLAMILTRKV